jgi:hypothetical protein
LGRRGYFMYPLKRLQKLMVVITINTKIGDPLPPGFSPNPMYPLKRI